MRRITPEQKHENYKKYQREYRKRNREKVIKWNCIYYINKLKELEKG